MRAPSKHKPVPTPVRGVRITMVEVDSLTRKFFFTKNSETPTPFDTMKKHGSSQLWMMLAGSGAIRMIGNSESWAKPHPEMGTVGIEISILNARMWDSLMKKDLFLRIMFSFGFDHML